MEWMGIGIFKRERAVWWAFIDYPGLEVLWRLELARSDGRLGPVL